MRKRVFAQRATVYRQEDAGWTRSVLEGVFLRRRLQRPAEGGVYGRRYRLRMTALWEDSKECPVREGDLIVPGSGPEEYSAGEMALLRAEGKCFAVTLIADNTGQERLKHWRIEAE